MPGLVLLQAQITLPKINPISYEPGSEMVKSEQDGAVWELTRFDIDVEALSAIPVRYGWGSENCL